ncbi:MAG: hypothetical protein EBS98_00320 [Chitinophagia bacterium]|nr:hypothetical protein [Chitinophagia bacterium]
MQSGWKSYFIFSKKEQRGIMVLGLILLSTMLLGILFPRKEMVMKDKFNQYYYVQEKGYEKNNVFEKNNTADNITSEQVGPLFYFDPNTMDSLTAIRLGIPSRQVLTLLRYRNKGGRFYRKEDIAKLYGLKKELVEKLIPYVVINNKAKAYSKKLLYVYKTFSKSHLSSALIVNKVFDKEKKVYKVKDKEANKEEKGWSIDINIADEKQWAAKTELSPSIIQNIMRYKNYLGGFTNLNQIKKVYGLNEANYYLLKPHLTLSKVYNHKLNASTMSFENWKALGLFGDREIAQILRLRKENGGRIGWKELVILFDLTAEQAEILQASIHISK